MLLRNTKYAFAEINLICAYQSQLNLGAKPIVSFLAQRLLHRIIPRTHHSIASAAG